MVTQRSSLILPHDFVTSVKVLKKKDEKLLKLGILQNPNPSKRELSGIWDVITKNHMKNVAEVARSSHSDERYLDGSFDPHDFSASAMRVYSSGIFFW